MVALQNWRKLVLELTELQLLLLEKYCCLLLVRQLLVFAQLSAKVRAAPPAEPLDSEKLPTTDFCHELKDELAAKFSVRG